MTFLKIVLPIVTASLLWPAKPIASAQPLPHPVTQPLPSSGLAQAPSKPLSGISSKSHLLPLMRQFLNFLKILPAKRQRMMPLASFQLARSETLPQPPAERSHRSTFFKRATSLLKRVIVSIFIHILKPGTSPLAPWFQSSFKSNNGAPRAEISTYGKGQTREIPGFPTRAEAQVWPGGVQESLHNASEEAGGPHIPAGQSKRQEGGKALEIHSARWSETGEIDFRRFEKLYELELVTWSSRHRPVVVPPPGFIAWSGNAQNQST
jgi:hypothetical protein